MTMPNDLQNQTWPMPWTNGRGLVTGATLSVLFATIIAIFRTMGTWSSSGVDTPNLPPGPLNVMGAPYNALCNGSDDSTAIQGALNAVAGSAFGSGAIVIPPGVRCKASGLTWTSPGTLDIGGAGFSSVLQLGATSGSIVSASNGIVTIHDLQVQYPTPATVTSGAFFTFSSCICYLKNLRVVNGYTIASFGNGVVNGGADNIIDINTSHDGFDVDVSGSATGQQYGIMTFRGLKFQGTSINTGAALNLVSGDTITVSDSNLAGFNVGVNATTSSSRSYLANLFFSNVLVDGAGGPTRSGAGWVFDGTGSLLARVKIVNSWSSGMGNQGMYFKNTKSVDLDNMTVINSGLNGILIDTGTHVFNMRGGTVSANSASNPGANAGVVAIAGANSLYFSGVRSGPTFANINTIQADTQSCGINIGSPTITNYMITNNDLTGNTNSLCDHGGGTAGTTKIVGPNIVGSAVP